MESYRTADGLTIEVFMTDENFNAIYEEFNGRFFGGTLPAYQIQFGNVTRPDGRQKEGHVDRERQAITISARLVFKDQVRRGLLHYMTHVFTGDGSHDGAFVAKLEQLAREGERWAACQVRQFRGNR